MKLISSLFVISLLILINCNNEEEESLTSTFVIKPVKTIPATSAVGDTLSFEFYINADGGLKKVEFRLDDKILLEKSKNFVSSNSDTTKLSFPVLSDDFNKILNFKVSIFDQREQSHVENVSIKVSDAITANYLMLKVEDVYSKALSYKDTGIVRTRYHYSNGGSYVNDKPFKTAILRSAPYRYEYYETGNLKNRMIIHRDNNGVIKTWWGIWGYERTDPSLRLTTSGAQGVSGRSSTLIPSFLLPNELGANLIRMLKDKIITGSELIGTNDCYKLTGVYYDGDVFTFLIQKNNFLIRRVLNNHQFDTFRTEATIDIQPEINTTLNEKEFTFNHP
jgi:hypothetical protein